MPPGGNLPESIAPRRAGIIFPETGQKNPSRRKWVEKLCKGKSNHTENDRPINRLVGEALGKRWGSSRQTTNGQGAEKYDIAEKYDNLPCTGIVSLARDLP
jgi:hypothetical protein